MPDDDDWRDRRRAAAEAQAEAFARRKAGEHEKARQVIQDFVAQATDRGIAPTLLTARSYSGSGRYRTRVRGWYIRRNGALAVGTDGEFYTLMVPGGLRARLTGAELPPTDPPLVVGAGGRDGESIALADLLQQRLDAGDDWP
jgi:hypothetical protein